MRWRFEEPPPETGIPGSKEYPGLITLDLGAVGVTHAQLDKHVLKWRMSTWLHWCQPRLLDPSCLARWASIPKRLFMMHDWTTFRKLHPQLLQVLDCASKAFCLLGIRRLRTTRRTNCEKRLEWSTSHSRFQVNHGIHHNFYAELLGFVRSWFIVKLSMNDREMAENQARTWKKPALQSSTGSSTTLSNATDKVVAGFFSANRRYSKLPSTSSRSSKSMMYAMKHAVNESKEEKSNFRRLQECGKPTCKARHTSETGPAQKPKSLTI